MVARRAHNPKVVGSNPAPATNLKTSITKHCNRKLYRTVAGWSSLVARRAHNPKVVGSNPAPATTLKTQLLLGFFFSAKKHFDFLFYTIILN